MAKRRGEKKPIVVSKSVARRLAVQTMGLTDEQRRAVMKKLEQQDEDKREGERR